MKVIGGARLDGRCVCVGVCARVCVYVCVRVCECVLSVGAARLDGRCRGILPRHP